MVIIQLYYIFLLGYDALYKMKTIYLFMMEEKILLNFRFMRGQQFYFIVFLNINQAVAEDPDDAVRWHQLGLHSLCSRQFKTAQQYIKAAVARFKECSYAWSNLGMYRAHVNCIIFSIFMFFVCHILKH